MTMTDLHLTADAIAAFLMWIATTAMVELVIKPFLRRKYQRLDRALGDRLPDLK
jgi:hypothetical protein